MTVPPGASTATRFCRRRPSHSANSRSCVLFPAPSGPSNTMSTPCPLVRSTKRNNRARRALLNPFENPIVHASHDFVEVFLGDEQTLISGPALDLSQEGIQLPLHFLGGTLPALHQPLRVDAKLLHPLEQR